MRGEICEGKRAKPTFKIEDRQQTEEHGIVLLIALTAVKFEGSLSLFSLEC